MRRLLLPLFLGLMLTLSACSPAPEVSPSPTAPSSPSPVPTVTVTPAPEAVAPVWGTQTGSYRETVPGHPDLMLVEGNFSLPHIENAAGIPSYTAINGGYETLLSNLKKDVQDNVPLALDDYETARSLEIPFLGYSDEEEYQVIYQSETTAAILRTHFAHSSGTFPSVIYLVDRFDLQTGAILRFADFFTDPDRAEAIILAEVKRQGAEHPEYDQEVIPLVFQREFFYPTETGLLFFYQPLTLKNDQAAVKPEFLVPYSILEGFLSR